MKDGRRALYWIGVLGVLGTLVGASLLAFLRSSRVEEDAKARTLEVKAGPRIQTVEVSRGGGDRDLLLQGEARPYLSVTLYAKVSGYLREVRVDKGDAVKQDQVLAVIESQELDREYEAEVADAKYKRDNAKRMDALAATGVASASDAELARSSADIAIANVATLATQKSYELLKAPFSGTVTARYADPGALVQQATAAQSSALPLVTVSEIDRLRVSVYVDQRDAPFVREKDEAAVSLPERPGLKLLGKVSRVSHELDPRTRMMLAEIDLDNRDGAVVPGSFVQVKLKVQVPGGLSLPVEALVLRGRKPFVAVVSAENKVTYVPVTLADNDGQRAYIKEGVREGQRVALNLGDSLKDGDAVRPAGGPSPQP
jgi:membrane fusion protein (multidrug efflux system)